MNELQRQWQTPSVPRDAQKPDPEWLTARVMSFLGHYFQPEETEMEFRMRMADWREDLEDLPQAAIEMAIKARRRSSDRARPTSGEIRELAKSFLLRSAPVADPAPFGPEVGKEPVTGDAAIRIAQEVYGEEVPSNIIEMARLIKKREAEDGAA